MYKLFDDTMYKLFDDRMYKLFDDTRRQGRNDRKVNRNKYNKEGVIVEPGRVVLSSGAIQTNNWVKINGQKETVGSAKAK